MEFNRFIDDLIKNININNVPREDRFSFRWWGF